MSLYTITGGLRYEAIRVSCNMGYRRKRDSHYDTEIEAKIIENGFHTAFGKQIQWTGIREVR